MLQIFKQRKHFFGKILCIAILFFEIFPIMAVVKSKFLPDICLHYKYKVIDGKVITQLENNCSLFFHFPTDAMIMHYQQ